MRRDQHRLARLPVTGEDRDPYGRVVGALGRLAGLFAGLAAGVYLTGGLVLSLRLGLERLPSTAAVAQLPREFLISLGLTVVVPAIVAGVLCWWVVRRAGRGDTSALVTGLAAAAVFYLAIGGVQVAKAPFPAKVCLVDGGETSGVLIGETDSRTYLGDPKQRASAADHLHTPVPY